MRKNSNIEKTRRNKLIVSYGGTEKYYRELDGEIAVQKQKTQTICGCKCLRLFFIINWVIVQFREIQKLAQGQVEGYSNLVQCVYF